MTARREQAPSQVRLAAANTVRLSLQVVRHVVEGVDSSVRFAGSPLGRIHRDLVSLEGHVGYGCGLAWPVRYGRIAGGSSDADWAGCDGSCVAS